jgi:motility quorum-sensing regulator / GCU-specific mRNA interferase toxin
MEKRKPHYDLSGVQRLVANPANQPLTVTALRGGLALGLTELEMRKVVLALTARDFFKAMTTHADYQTWRDVYNGMTQHGDLVYIKITGFTDGRPPVIQFKAK